MLRHAPLAVALLLSPMLLACPGGGEPPEVCSVPRATEPLPDTRTVELGERVGGELVLYADGDVAEVVVGGQGGEMILPRARVSAEPEDGDTLCLEVITELQHAPGGELVRRVRSLVYERDGDWFDLDEQRLVLRRGSGPAVIETRVRGAGFESRFGPVEIELR